MSTRWGDEEPSDHGIGAPPAAESTSGGPPRRKKLALKPRGSASASHAASTSSGSKSSIFGAAKPREEVLASKGIDAKLVDERIQKKATTVHYTKDQNEEIQAIQAQLTNAEADLRDANEKELPEESYRVVVEQKRKELHDLMEVFQKENAEKQATAEEEKGETRKHYERPSERRKRLEEQRHQQEGGGGSHYNNDNRYDHHEEQQEDAFQHFGGRNKHHSHGSNRNYNH